MPREFDIIAYKHIKVQLENGAVNIKLKTKGRTQSVSIIPRLSKRSKATFKAKQVPAECVRKMQLRFGLSQKVTEGITSEIRSWKGRNFFSGSIKEEFKYVNKELESFFSITTLNMDVKVNREDKQQEQSLVFCNDVKGFYNFIREKHQLNNSETIAKIGIDDGKDYLKATMNIVEVQGHARPANNHRFSYTAGYVGEHKFKDSGVKKLFILSASQKVKETYQNTKLSLDCLDLKDIPHIWTPDIKEVNHILSIQSPGGSKFGCGWCEKSRDKWMQRSTPGTLRTVGKIIEDHKMYQAEKKTQAPEIP